MGDERVRTATQRYIAELEALRNPAISGWEMTYNRPVIIGYLSLQSYLKFSIFKKGFGVKAPSAAISPLVCRICQQDPRALYYHVLAPKTLTDPLQVPHEFNYLRNHFAEQHPEMLSGFVKGWHALPERFQARWSAEGCRLDGTYTGHSYGFELFNTWADILRLMWNRGIIDMGRQIQDARMSWKHTVGKQNWYFPTTPDPGFSASLTSLQLELPSLTAVTDFLMSCLLSEGSIWIWRPCLRGGLCFESGMPYRILGGCGEIMRGGSSYSGRLSTFGGTMMCIQMKARRLLQPSGLRIHRIQ